MADLPSVWATMLPPGVTGACRPVPAGVEAAREREYRCGRQLLRDLLAARGLPDQAVPRSAAGAPIWPPGWAGSLSHTAVWCLAAIAPTSAVTSIGVDVEAISTWTPALCELVLTPAERRLLETYPHAEQDALTTAIFSAKESLYKTLNPCSGAWLDFHDAELVAATPTALDFAVNATAYPRLTAHWRRCDNHVLTLVVLQQSSLRLRRSAIAVRHGARMLQSECSNGSGSTGCHPCE